MRFGALEGVMVAIGVMWALHVNYGDERERVVRAERVASARAFEARMPYRA